MNEPNKLIQYEKNSPVLSVTSVKTHQWTWVTEIWTCYMIPGLCLYFACRAAFTTKNNSFIKWLERK